METVIMLQISLYDIVSNALENYHDLVILEQSELRMFQSLWPLPPLLIKDTLRLPLRGAAIQYLLDRAITQLTFTQPSYGILLRQRYVHKQDDLTLCSQVGFSAVVLQRYCAAAISKLAAIVLNMETEARTENSRRLRYQLAYVPPSVTTSFVRREGLLQTLVGYLRRSLTQPQFPILVMGVGGIGKSRLITDALNHWLGNEIPPIERILWARIDSRGQGSDPEQIADGLLSQIGQQLEVALLAVDAVTQRIQHLAIHFARFRQRFVIVIDNVKNDVELASALMVARGMTHMSLVVIGSRVQNTSETIATLTLSVPAMSKVESCQLVSMEAKGTLPLETIEKIVHVVGGHPLALSLVVAQQRFLPLDDVIDYLINRTPSANELYYHLHAKSWQLLSARGRSILNSLRRSPFQGSRIVPLLHLAHRADPTLNQSQLEVGLNDLQTLNLICVTTEPPAIYFLHPLTCDFLEQYTSKLLLPASE